MKRRATPPRNRNGRFTKRRHAGHTQRRKRQNPVGTVLAANPHRRRRKARRTHRRSTALVVRRGAPAHRRRKNPSRRRRRRHHGHVAHVRRRRNPSGGGINRRKIGFYLKVGAFGMAGILFVRVAKNFYVKHLEETVLGAEGKADPKSWRAIANDFLKHVFMAAGVIALERFALRRFAANESRLAFVVGGLAETVRNGTAVALERISPTTDRARFGLDGSQNAVIQDGAGAVWVLAQDGHYYKYEDLEMAGLMDPDDLQGLIQRGSLAA
jgi:hypothetical protein